MKRSDLQNGSGTNTSCWFGYTFIPVMFEV